ncbi:putative protein traI (plasmid) [Coxiella burnetii 'MSU Goat Q177']|nr:putative protein traI [Coxiella burnetii 'MSU Goat Q177']
MLCEIQKLTQLLIETKKPLASELTRLPYQEEPSMTKKAVNYGISVIASREATFTYQSVVEKSLSYGNANVSFKAVQIDLRERVKSGELMTRQSPSGDVLLATKETVALEQTIIDQIKSGKNTVTPFLLKDEIQHKLDASSLTEGQKAAYTLLATTQDRFVMVQGYAGTGKSTMLKTLQDALSQSNIINKESIIALAPTHKAVKELQSKGIEAQTVKSFLVGEAHLSLNNYRHLDNKLILLDESSMVGNRDFQQLQSIVEKAKNCHCAYIGDKAQLLSVEDGKPAEIAYLSREADIATATMSEVLRQKDPELKKITQELMMSTPESVDRALTQLKQNGWVIEESSVDRKGPISDSVQKIAEHYCALSLEERTNTVIAAATNENRQTINEAIRVIRQGKGELQGEFVTTTLLMDSRLTDAELHHSPNYTVGDVVRLNNQYLTVSKTNHDKNTLILEDGDKQNKVLNLDLMPKRETVELFHRETTHIQSGDILKWTKSDKERGLVAHESLRVTHVNKAEHTITALSEKSEHLSIDLNQPQNQHIDYNYASTVHGLQGATAQSILILLDSHNSLSNTMRLLYVAVTRSTHQVRIFTDNLEAVRFQIIHEKGDKKSALETIGLLTMREEQPLSPDSKNVNANATSSNHYFKKASHKSERIDAKAVEDGLRFQVQNICEDLLGKPNPLLSNPANWRYGRKGSLSIMTGGQHQGSFHNFETGEKGSMIQLLMSELGLDFKSALEQRHWMLGGDLITKTEVKSKSKPSIPDKDDAASRKVAYINKLIKQSVPLSGTVAERYLTDRAIRNVFSPDLKFIEKINTGRGNQAIKPFASALLAIARDKNGEVKAIQVTYLDTKDGHKLEGLKIKKRTSDH